MSLQKRIHQTVIDGYNYTVGGWENAIADGLEEAMPAFEQMQAEIYDYVIHEAEEFKFYGRDNLMALIQVVFIAMGEYSIAGEGN